MAPLLGKIYTMLVCRLKLSCQGRELSAVSEHGSVDRVGEVALQNPHCFASCVAVGSSAVVEFAGAWFVAELDHRDAVDDRVEAPVAAA